MSNNYTVNGRVPTPEDFQAAADWSHRALNPGDYTPHPMEDDLVTDETVSFVERHREENAHMHKSTSYESHGEFNRQGAGGRIAREGLGAMNRHGFVMSATHLDRPDAGTRAARLQASEFADRVSYRGSQGRTVGLRPSMPLDASRGDRAYETGDGTRYELDGGSDPDWMDRRAITPLRASDERSTWSAPYRETYGLNGTAR